MQTMPLPKTFPSSLPSWNKSLIINSLNHINLITESVWSPTGSCCDDGRYIFKQCKAWWWYMCHRDQGYNYGAVNYTTWLRFGRNGFTFPTGKSSSSSSSSSPFFHSIIIIISILLSIYCYYYYHHHHYYYY